MNAAERAKSFESLIERLRRAYRDALAAEPLEPTPPVPLWLSDDPVLREFLRAFLAWECPASRARSAMEAIESAFIDANDLRVSLAPEIAAALGRTYPRALDRAERLKSALNEVYRKEHAVSLVHLRDKPRRDARAYLEALPGTPHFVAAWTHLFALGGHAVPVDDRVAARLISAGLANEGDAPDALSAALEKIIRAGMGVEVARLLQAWCDDPDPPSTKPARSRPRPTAAKRSPARRQPRAR